MSRLTIQDIQKKKKQSQKIVMLTAYDYSLASFLDKADVDIILVGDSLAHVVLGLDSTTKVGMSEMLHHAKAVNRAVKKAMLVADMPFQSYDDSQNGVLNAKRFVEEAGCNAVKIEWFDGCVDVAAAIIKAGIPVIGHVGLTPQTAEQFKVQGQDAQSARVIIQHAEDLQKCGCFAVVLECVPSPVAEIITKRLTIPTIGIGAGVDCDGQVLVTHDLLGLFERFKPKFVKQYVNLGQAIVDGVKQFSQDVRTSRFPDSTLSYSMNEKELEKLHFK